MRVDEKVLVRVGGKIRGGGMDCGLVPQVSSAAQRDVLGFFCDTSASCPLRAQQEVSKAKHAILHGGTSESMPQCHISLHHNSHNQRTGGELYTTVTQAEVL